MMGCCRFWIPAYAGMTVPVACEDRMGYPDFAGFRRS